MNRCNSSAVPITLAVGQYTSIDPASGEGCTVFPAAGSSPAQYLVVPQITTGFPGQSVGFRLTGDTVRPGASSMTLSPLESASRSPVEEFHAFLRRGDADAWRGMPRRAARGPLQPLPSPAGPPPTVGDQRSFHVCANLTCMVFEDVVATAKSVKNKVAIFVDNAAPAGGLDATQLDNLATTFDTRLYPTDTTAFGVESDIDGNTVVLVLMTPVVNRMVTASECNSSGFVSGFFYGLDLLPQLTNSNAAEIFYSMVPDPTGSQSCAHSTTQVERLIPVTFIHEFQHMISFNQHVLVRGGTGEMLWLNEAFSHYAEELGGRTYAPTAPEFTRFIIGDLFNAYEYLESTGQHFLLPNQGIGSLAERGAGWLFVRYLVDRFGGTTPNAFTRSMVQTSAVGDANVVAATGQSFQTIVTRWALANYVSDLPGFTAPTELKYDSWAFRTTYQSLNAQDPNNFPKPFPLTPTQSNGREVSLTGTLRGGSGVYHLVQQPANDRGFTLQFSANGTPFQNGYFARLNVIRLQ